MVMAKATGRRAADTGLSATACAVCTTSKTWGGTSSSRYTTRRSRIEASAPKRAKTDVDRKVNANTPARL